MKRIVTTLCLVASVFLAGCHKPEVKFTDMRPTPTATVSDSTVTVHLGEAYLTSAYWVHAKSKIKDHTIYVYGYYTLSEISHEYVVKLPASLLSQTVSVVWLDPAGSQVPIPSAK